MDQKITDNNFTKLCGLVFSRIHWSALILWTSKRVLTKSRLINHQAGSFSPVVNRKISKNVQSPVGNLFSENELSDEPFHTKNFTSKRGFRFQPFLADLPTLC